MNRTAIYAVLLFLSTVAPLRAQSPAGQAAGAKTASAGLDKVAQRVTKLSDQLKSPFCPGKTLKSCTHPNAGMLRREIESMMNTGLSNDEIVKRLQARFPATQLENPEQPWYTFFVPFLPYILGGSLMFVVLLNWRRDDKSVRSGMADVDVDDLKRGTDSERQERLARLRSRVQRDE